MLDIFKENKRTAWLEQSEKAEAGNAVGKVARHKVMHGPAGVEKTAFYAEDRENTLHWFMY